MSKQTSALARLRNRDSDAVAEWFRTYSRHVYTFVFYRVGRDADIAAEVVQETFTTALTRLDDFDPGRGTMKVWLCFLARNCIRTVAGQVLPLRQGFDEESADALASIDDRELPDELLVREETAHLVRTALTRVSPVHQQVLVERYWRQRPLSEVAADLGISEGAVKGRLHRARLAFRDELVRLVGSSFHAGLVQEVSR